MNIYREIFTSARWSSVGDIVNYFASFLRVVIIARYVNSADYGLAIIATSIVTFFMVFSQSGLSQTIIYFNKKNKRLIDTIFTATLIFGIVIFSTFIIFSNYMAIYYEKEDLGWILNVSSIGIIFAALEAIPSSILQKELKYRAQNLIKILKSTIIIFTTLLFLSLGCEILSIIMPSIFASIFAVIFGFYKTKIIPNLRLDWRLLKISLAVGLNNLISNISNYICNNGTPIFMGKIWLEQTTAGYVISDRVNAMLSNGVIGQLTSSIFPIFKKIGKDGILKSLYGIISIQINIILPIIIIIYFSADIFFTLVLGEKWSGAVVFFRWFLILQMFKCFFAPSTSILYALKGYNITSKIVIVRLFLFFTLVILAIEYNLTPENYVVGYVISDMLVIFLYFIATINLLKINLVNYLYNIFPGAIFSIIFINFIFIIINISSKVNDDRFFVALTMLLSSIFLYICYFSISYRFKLKLILNQAE